MSNRRDNKSFEYEAKKEKWQEEQFYMHACQQGKIAIAIGMAQALGTEKPFTVISGREIFSLRSSLHEIRQVLSGKELGSHKSSELLGTMKRRAEM
ncbi:hypothetical protein NPIL_335031 [Nephila pilipes]|uniref:TIP49 P-loop domain-containing protein n=1 Tax=Nephila pilipes TaxID=299642 RepID=A0A8X6THI7_NEPPI|nr:hypothetical protein NPIL_335031 [Nephila pilipes]